MQGERAESQAVSGGVGLGFWGQPNVPEVDREGPPMANLGSRVAVFIAAQLPRRQAAIAACGRALFVVGWNDDGGCAMRALGREELVELVGAPPLPRLY